MLMLGMFFYFLLNFTGLFTFLAVVPETLVPVITDICRVLRKKMVTEGF